ncbi:MAG: ImmA/IrrE family metallo-endopeptidase [Micromonosporaceae bacterium]|nr:ImmA/IrrE family metallo-endopeptidase [Micromonosporaceae bacterium]
MRRGFKTEAERLADRMRAQLGLEPHDRMAIRNLAIHLGVEMHSADSLVARSDLDELNRIQPGAFSAATFHLPGGRTAIITNPDSEPGRINSDIAHEIAHLLLNHEVRELQQLGGHTFFTCNPEQEEEANWLGACLLLSRALLLREAFAGSDPTIIAQRYDVSIPMARFRLNASGVLLQAKRARSSHTRR